MDDLIPIYNKPGYYKDKKSGAIIIKKNEEINSTNSNLERRVENLEQTVKQLYNIVVQLLEKNND